MKRSRLVALFALCSVPWGAAAGCGSEDDGGAGLTTGGGAGTQATGGTTSSSGGFVSTDASVSRGTAGAGQAGAAVEAGAGGQAGIAGQIGTAGQSGATGGTSATGGNMGTGGAGGNAGTGGSTGSGGSAGMAGGGSTGATPICAEACDSNTDCRISMVDSGYTCNLTTRRCGRFAEPCRSDEECIPSASAWLQRCNSTADCFFFPDSVCVNVGGVGWCARPPGQTDAGAGCQEPATDVIELPQFGSTGMVSVCADTSQKCHDGACIAPCTDNAQCTSDRNGSICNMETGVCECVRDQDCRGFGVSHCNLTTRRCECANDMDCDAVPNADACINGACGCRSVTACQGDRVFSGTTWVCE